MHGHEFYVLDLPVRLAFSARSTWCWLAVEVASSSVSTTESGAGVGQSSCLVMVLGRLLLAGQAKVGEGLYVL